MLCRRPKWQELYPLLLKALSWWYSLLNKNHNFSNFFCFLQGCSGGRRSIDWRRQLSFFSTYFLFGRSFECSGCSFDLLNRWLDSKSEIFRRGRLPELRKVKSKGGVEIGVGLKFGWDLCLLKGKKSTGRRELLAILAP